MILPGSSIAPVILAAGASSRLGEPKALAKIGGRTVLQHLLDALACCQAQLAAPCVVTGRHADEIAASIAHAGPARTNFDCVENTDWRAGRTGSFFQGASARAGHHVLLWPVDVPMVTSATIDSLCSAWTSEGEPPRGWLAPRYAGEDGEGRFGHPVLIGAELVQICADMSADRPLKALRERAESLLSIDTKDPGVLNDLDTPADLAELRQRYQG